MPVAEATVLNITCDNPNCPGNNLEPTDRTGWFFVSSEIYGQPTVQHVFCSASCAAAAALDELSSFASPMETKQP
jgi:hypothetical protein